MVPARSHKPDDVSSSLTPATNFIMKIKINILDLVLLGVVYGCIKHYSGHNCLALASVAGMIYLKRFTRIAG